MTVTEQIVNKNGLKLHLLKTEKYKTNTIVFKMKSPLNQDEATMRALLPYVLQSGTNTYPTTTELRSYLEDLYGAILTVDLQKKGEFHVISISMEIANEKFLIDSEPLLEKAVAFLAEVIQKPMLVNNMFDEKIVEKEKRTLKNRIQAVFDDKMRYANLRLVEEMCKAEPYSVPVNGILTAVDQITALSLYDYYQKCLQEDELDLYIVGDFQKSEAEEVIEKYFSFANRTPKEISQQTAKRNILNEKQVVEKQAVSQGKLNIGFRTNVTYGSNDYYALQIFNGLFGGFPHSKLFLNVREKESLAYYAASRIESHKGLLMVMSGIEPKNFEKTVQIVKEQFIAMQTGDFTDFEIEQTKAVIINQMLETMDTARGVIEVLYHNVISKRNVTLEDWLKGIEQATKEQVIAVSKNIELDTIYFLTGMEG